MKKPDLGRAAKAVKSLVGDHPSSDLLVAASVTIFYAWKVALGGATALGALPQDQRGVLLQTLAGIAVGLFGVAFTAVAIVTAVPSGDRLGRLNQEFPTFLPSVFRSVIAAYAIGAVGLVSVALLDQGPAEVWGGTVLVASVALVLVRTARLIWIFQKVLQVIMLDKRAEGSSLSESERAQLFLGDSPNEDVPEREQLVVPVETAPPTGPRDRRRRATSPAAPRNPRQ